MGVVDVEGDGSSVAEAHKFRGRNSFPIVMTGAINSSQSFPTSERLVSTLTNYSPSSKRRI